MIKVESRLHWEGWCLLNMCRPCSSLEICMPPKYCSEKRFNGFQQGGNIEHILKMLWDGKMVILSYFLLHSSLKCFCRLEKQEKNDLLRQKIINRHQLFEALFSILRCLISLKVSLFCVLYFANRRKRDQYRRGQFLKEMECLSLSEIGHLQRYVQYPALKSTKEVLLEEIVFAQILQLNDWRGPALFLQLFLPVSVRQNSQNVQLDPILKGLFLIFQNTIVCIDP